jgi:hypothetical protein
MLRLLVMAIIMTAMALDASDCADLRTGWRGEMATLNTIEIGERLLFINLINDTHESTLFDDCMLPRCSSHHPPVHSCSLPFAANLDGLTARQAVRVPQMNPPIICKPAFSCPLHIVLIIVHKSCWLEGCFRNQLYVPTRTNTTHLLIFCPK